MRIKKGVSNIWARLVSSFSVMGDWHAWFLGNGRSILEGEDPIIGGPRKFNLSKELILILRSKGYIFLHHIATRS